MAIFQNQKINLKTRDGIRNLDNITNHNARKKLVKKNPEIVLYAAKYWSNDKKFSELVNYALIKKPEIILGFKNKNGLNVNYNTVYLAVMADPMIISKMNNEMREVITPELFIKAFVKNPLVLTIKDLEVLNYKFHSEITVTERNKETGLKERVTKKYSCTLRNECLKAIRLSEKISKYHEGYDDIAYNIAQQLDKSRDFQNKKYSTELLSKFSTLMNSLIKKNDQKLRVVSVDAWLVNKGKPMYKAVRTSAKDNSHLEGLISDMPTSMLPEKIIVRLIIAAVKTNPGFYLKLDEYGFGKYKDNATIKYNVYKSLKKHKLLEWADCFLRTADIEKSKTKLVANDKRQETRKRKQAEKKEAMEKKIQMLRQEETKEM